MRMFLHCVKTFVYNYVQLARSFKRKSCHASPLKNKCLAVIVRCQKLLNTEGLNLKNRDSFWCTYKRLYGFKYTASLPWLLR